jgi:twitching motility protein PilT
MKIKDFLKIMVEKLASDLFLRAGGIPHLRIDGRVSPIDNMALSVEDMRHILDEVLTDEQKKRLKEDLDVDFVLSLTDLGRFRFNAFIQRGSPSIVVRYVKEKIQTFEELNLPAEILKNFASESRGLVLVTGPAGSGKSTTIGCMLDYINETSARHIITVEDPIEFLFRDKKSVFNQRELGLDVQSYPSALKHFTLQSPDVIYIGVIRDTETMMAAMTAAEMGVLVVSTFHTINTVQTIERIMNFYPPHIHEEVRMQLSLLLKGVISLRLIPQKDSAGRIPACETMVITPSIARVVREGKLTEIAHFIEEGEMFGMRSFKQSLVKLVQEGKVTEEDARRAADSRDEFDLELRGIKRIA